VFILAGLVVRAGVPRASGLTGREAILAVAGTTLAPFAAASC